MSLPGALVVIGIVLIAISAFWNPPGASLWNLGWAFVLAGALGPTQGGFR
jgi:hypothetical protein